MLVLSRRPNEKIFINHDIIVTVLRIVGNKVRLGIEAPKAMPVHRSEIHEAMKNQDPLKALA
jgi:carbon storage regulator